MSNKIREVTEVTNHNPGPGEYKAPIGFENILKKLLKEKNDIPFLPKPVIPFNSG
jgi:hypothetical protein